ncbi:alkaline phosphatase family protein [Nocardioides sp. GY 10127]|uniref:alkaline phosphatase family protein n=1 Tax=Nocardioides sp. GY 10127 TaxID=2569762 RepID=UPI0010A94002|nr:alkaline phosphatase family protein [Nocardioides sp. GY 10127]TIC80166.1 alkaline phosphatase family protein [Nocardioides sp. GY 10127]
MGQRQGQDQRERAGDERSLTRTRWRRARLGATRLARFRPSRSWALDVVRSFVVSFLALTLSLWALPGTQADHGAESVAALAVGVLVVGALLRPLLTRLTVLTGVVGLLLAGLLTQALVLAVALAVIPTVDPFPWPEILLASWSAAVAAAGVNWLFDASGDEAFLGQVLRRATQGSGHPGHAGAGLLVVQLDGVSEPLLRQAVVSGAVPTVSRWLRSGDYRLRRWHTGIPSTTPAGQAVLLHGDDTSVPGYRWWDKDLGRLLVVSKQPDLAVIQPRLSATSGHRGLLADGGASVAVLFSGDAPTKLLTMSEAGLPRGGRGAAAFATYRSGFLRSIVLFVGQIVTELHQARRQRIRGVEPRVSRLGPFLFLRGLTTVVLRDLNLSIVADLMTSGTPAIFVDFVDYDEVAHHAGPSRPESMRVLENLDRTLQLFTDIAAEADRAYEIVVVSDHGQAQGRTFEQLTGRPLRDVVQGLAGACEPSGPLATQAGAAQAAAQAAAEGLLDGGERMLPASLLLAGGSRSQQAAARAVTGAAERSRARHAEQPASPIVVAASGGLAHVYRTDLPGRLTHDDLARLHPALVDGLAHQEGIGLVVTRTGGGHLRVTGPTGWRLVRPGPEDVLVEGGEGPDPLTPFGPLAAADLLELEGKDGVGDLVLLGACDPDLGEVVAFEELVGSHGGVGGDQTEALFLHPASWDVPDAALRGVDVHAALVHRLEQLGLRPGTPDAGPAARTARESPQAPEAPQAPETPQAPEVVA